MVAGGGGEIDFASQKSATRMERVAEGPSGRLNTTEMRTGDALPMCRLAYTIKSAECT